MFQILNDRPSSWRRTELDRRAPRVCVLTQYFPPEMGAPQTRLSELGERLIDFGWDVEVLTALPNYPTGVVFNGYDPLQPCVEHIGRIRTVRVPLYTAKNGFVRRLRSYFSFVRSAQRHGPRLCRRPDLVFVESPPLFIGYAARHLSRKWHCPYVFNVSDLWPESAIRMGIVKRGWMTSLAERLELKIYRGAAGVTGQSDEIIESVRARHADVPTSVVTNGVVPERFGPQCADSAACTLLGSEPGPIFIYAGLLGMAQGLDQLLDLANSLPAEIPGRIVLVGEGPMKEHLRRRIASESISRVELRPAQQKERIPALLAAADAAIISLAYTIPGAVPSKIYEAMAASLPILLVADGEPARRVRQAEAGLTVRPGDTGGLRDAFSQLATDAALRERLGSAGRKAAVTIYNRETIARRLDQFLRSLLRVASHALR